MAHRMTAPNGIVDIFEPYAFVKAFGIWISLVHEESGSRKIHLASLFY